MEGQKEQAVIRRGAFCALSDQSLNFLSHISICRKRFSHFLHDLKTIYESMNIDIYGKGKQGLLLHKPGFPKWCHILQKHSVTTYPKRSLPRVVFLRERVGDLAVKPLKTE